MPDRLSNREGPQSGPFECLLCQAAKKEQTGKLLNVSYKRIEKDSISILSLVPMAKVSLYTWCQQVPHKLKQPCPSIPVPH